MEGTGRRKTKRRLAKTGKYKTRKRKIAGSQRRGSTRGGICERIEEGDDSREREGERERAEGLKERRASPRNAFSSFSPSGHQSEAPAIPSRSQSQTKSHGFTYYDLHPCPLCLFYSSFPPRPFLPSIFFARVTTVAVAALFLSLSLSCVSRSISSSRVSLFCLSSSCFIVRTSCCLR